MSTTALGLNGHVAAPFEALEYESLRVPVRCAAPGCGSDDCYLDRTGDFVICFTNNHSNPSDRYSQLREQVAEKRERFQRAVAAPPRTAPAAAVAAARVTTSQTPAAQTFLSAPPRERVWAETKIAVETAREIAATAPERPDWLATGLAAVGAVTELDGLPKSAGKTTFTAFMVRAILDGEPFLGRPTNKSGVLMLTEQTPTTLRETLELAGLLDRGDLAFVRWHRHRGIPFAEVVEQAASECLRRAWRLLVVDTIGQWAGIQGDAENHSGAAMAAMEPCQEAAGRGLAVWVARHDRKSGGEVGQSGRGSNAFSGAVDIVLQLGRPEGNAPPTHRVLSALSRFRETTPRVVIDLTPRGYVSLGDVSAVVTHNVREAILDVLPAEREQAWTFERISAACPPDANGRAPGRSTVQRTLDALVSCEHGPARVATATLPERGKPRVYWLIVSAQTPIPIGAETNKHAPIISAHTPVQRAETNPSTARCEECGVPSGVTEHHGRRLCFECRPSGARGKE